jgi:osmotically-inducible protein OsmY
MSRKVDADQGSAVARRRIVNGWKPSNARRGDAMARSDSDIQRDVEAELHSDPKISSNAEDIAVKVSNGVVVLTGFVHSYIHKFDAEDVAKRVAGVAGVVNNIEVRLPQKDQRPDPEIARDIVAAIRKRLPNVAERIKVVVTNGLVTLEGEVEWNYQREGVEREVRRVKGVKDISALIQIKPKKETSPAEIQTLIKEALRRSAEVDARRITVETNDSKVVLKGTVRSLAERQEAERAAWSVPGVSAVKNEIVVVYTGDQAEIDAAQGGEHLPAA